MSAEVLARQNLSKRSSSGKGSSSEGAFRVYLSFIRTAFLNMLAYRLRYFTGIITYLLFVSVHFFIWKAIFSGYEPGHRINGFSFEEMVSYLTIGWIARSLYFSNIDREIDNLVRTGQISIYLIRPVNFQLMMSVHALGESLFRLLFFTLPIAIVILLLFPVSPPPSIMDFLLFLLGTVFSFLVLAGLNFLVGLLAFSLKSIEGVVRAKYYIVQLFSGLLLPLPFFPDWLRAITDVLPFQVIAYIPLQLYLGKVAPADLLATLGTQVAWVLALYIAGAVLWSRAFAKLTLQGG